MKQLSLDTTVHASPQQVSCNVANEAVLLSMRDGEYYGLNEVAAAIWRIIQTPKTVREIRDGLLMEYEDITPEECERAVLEFLREMLSLQMVELL